MLRIKKIEQSETSLLRYARIRIDQIKTLPFFSARISEELTSLAQSMRTCGQLQPLIVRSNGDSFELVAGERRYKAALMAGFKYVDVMIIRTNEQSSLIISLAERISLKMHFFDEARMLRDAAAAGLTYHRISEATGIALHDIVDKIRLMQFDNEIKEIIITNNLTETQARELLNVPEKNRYLRLEEILHPVVHTPPPLRISGLVRNGCILAQPVLQVLDKLEDTGVKYDLRVTEDADSVQLNIKLHKKISQMPQQE